MVNKSLGLQSDNVLPVDRLQLSFFEISLFILFIDVNQRAAEVTRNIGNTRTALSRSHTSATAQQTL